jgi:hypothetical protein
VADRKLLTSCPGWANDTGDEDVLEWVGQRCWKDWENAYRPWWRQVEDNVRMLSGRHWDAYIQGLNDFVDLSTYFAIDDERWRRYPVFNWVAHYYKLTLSKLTENPPGIGYLPKTPDEIDARLAQVMEPVFKSMWLTMDMPELAFDLYGWIITAARGVTKQIWNPDLGPVEDYLGEVTVTLLTGDGPVRRTLSSAPYVQLPDAEDFQPYILNPIARGPDNEPQFDEETGEPMFEPVEDGEDGIKWGPPHRSRLGDIECKIIPPVAVITPHGPEPFHRKGWYTHAYPMHVDEIQERWDIEVDPEQLTFDEVLELKLIYGTHYGMPGKGTSGFGLAHIDEVSLRDMAMVREHWIAERPGHPVLSRGRLIITAANAKVGYDDINPYFVPGTHEEAVMPFEAFDLVKFPFRQEGSSDLEIISPINRAVNRRMGGLMEAADYNEQPLTLVKRQAQIDEEMDELNKPGAGIEYTDTNGRPPVERVAAAELPRGSFQLAETLQTWMQMFGSQPRGSEGEPVTTDPSGELQREVRFDTDRAWGAVLRKHGYCWSRFALKGIGIYAACLSDERILTLSGQDNGWDFLAIHPEMFQGAVHAYPQPESMVLETRQERQNRLLALRTSFPEIPAETFIELLGYPDLARLTRPGGPAWAMAERENLEIMLGGFPPVLPEHDHAAHLANHKCRMQTIEYRNAPPNVQAAMRAHVRLHEMLGQQESIRQVGLAAPVANAQALAAGSAAMLGQGPGGGGNGAPGGNGGPKPLPPEAAKAPRGADLAEGRATPGQSDQRATARLKT